MWLLHVVHVGFEPRHFQWWETVIFFFFYLGFMAHQDYFAHFKLSQSKAQAKMGESQEKPHDHPQAD